MALDVYLGRLKAEAETSVTGQQLYLPVCIMCTFRVAVIFVSENTHGLYTSISIHIGIHAGLGGNARSHIYSPAD